MFAAKCQVRDHPEVGAYVPGLTEAPCSEACCHWALAALGWTGQLIEMAFCLDFISVYFIIFHYILYI